MVDFSVVGLTCSWRDCNNYFVTIAATVESQTPVLVRETSGALAGFSNTSIIELCSAGSRKGEFDE